MWAGWFGLRRPLLTVEFAAGRWRDMLARRLGLRRRIRPPLPDAYWRRVETAEQMVLYSLLPDPEAAESDHADRFHGYPVLGRVALHPSRIAEVYIALRAGADAGSNGFRCWMPHHGVSVRSGGQGLDLVICFTCECMHVYADPQCDEFVWADMSDGPCARLDRMFKQAGVPLAPREE